MIQKYDQLLAEIAHRNWIILVVLVLFSLFWQSLPITMGVLAGGVLVIINYRWMGRSLFKLLNEPQLTAGKSYKRNYLFRLVFITTAIYLLLVRGEILSIIGPNGAGKSTLFNRLVGGRVSIVDDLPGTTRDRLLSDISWWGREFTLVDTGGLETRPGCTMAQRIKGQVEAAIAEADVILFMVDAQDGLELLEEQFNLPANSVERTDHLQGQPALAKLLELGIGPAGRSRVKAKAFQMLMQTFPLFLQLGRRDTTQRSQTFGFVGKPWQQLPGTCAFQCATHQQEGEI